jgi:hypothetical protein
VKNTPPSGVAAASHWVASCNVFKTRMRDASPRGESWVRHTAPVFEIALGAS